jgi:hypothetical protein
MQLGEQLDEHLLRIQAIREAELADLDCTHVVRVGPQAVAQQEVRELPGGHDLAV